MKDIAARWELLQRVRESPAFNASRDPALTQPISAPPIDMYSINVSFSALKDRAEFEYLNDLPTSFMLSPEAVDRLRAAAAKILIADPEFQRLLKDSGARIVGDPR